MLAAAPVHGTSAIIDRQNLSRYGILNEDSHINQIEEGVKSAFVVYGD